MPSLEDGKAYLKVCGLGRHYPECLIYRGNPNGCANCPEVVLKNSKGERVN